jgi:hypothetical protein
MVIDELDTSAAYRLAKIMQVLESTFSITLDFTAAKSRAELQSIYEEFGAVRSRIIQEARFNSYNQDSEYTKACLIQEAISIFLSEVAPKRRNGRIKKSA